MSEQHNRIISVAGRTFHASATMGDIFLAHVSDIVGRGETALVPLVHEGGVEQLFVGPTSVISVADAPVPDITPAATRRTITAA
jgi:hypothetical protein